MNRRTILATGLVTSLTAVAFAQQYTPTSTRGQSPAQILAETDCRTFDAGAKLTLMCDGVGQFAYDGNTWTTLDDIVVPTGEKIRTVVPVNTEGSYALSAKLSSIR